MLMAGSFTYFSFIVCIVLIKLREFVCCEAIELPVEFAIVVFSLNGQTKTFYLQALLIASTVSDSPSLSSLRPVALTLKRAIKAEDLVFYN